MRYISVVNIREKCPSLKSDFGFFLRTMKCSFQDMKRHRSLKGLYIEVAKHTGTLNELFFKPVAANISRVFPEADLALGTR